MSPPPPLPSAKPHPFVCAVVSAVWIPCYVRFDVFIGGAGMREGRAVGASVVANGRAPNNGCQRSQAKARWVSSFVFTLCGRVNKGCGTVRFVKSTPVQGS